MVYNVIWVIALNKTYIGNRIAELRIAKGVSAREMSLALGQNASYINKIENQRSLPASDVLLEICDYLGITPSEFFDEGNSVPEHHRQLYADIRRLSPSQTKLVSELVAEIARGNK